MPAQKLHVLIVDDDQKLRDLLLRYLRHEGFWVSSAASVKEARYALTTFCFDLVVLDVMMPDEEGLALFEQSEDVLPPVLLLSARGAVDDRIQGLSLGAKDYLIKPFDPRELLLRMRNILGDGRISGVLQIGDVVFHPQDKRIQKGMEDLILTDVEHALLGVFAAHAGETLSRSFLSSRIEGCPNPRTIDVQVNRLRQKIEPCPKVPRYLQTVRSKGYVLKVNAG